VSPRETGDKKGSDLVKVYVILFALFSVGLGYWFLKLSNDRAAYERARVEAERLLTKGGIPTTARSRGPATIYDAGTDILKYLETYQSTQLKSGAEGSVIPLKEIETRIQGAGLEVANVGGLQRVPNQRDRYEEYSTTFTMREVPNLENFATLLYNIEAVSTSIRVLDLRWNLITQPTKNPYPPGNAISTPTFRLGVRRPMLENRP
jgi:hypothetical protein